jgi:hypothetical protein
MRNTSVGSEKERSNMNLSASGIEIQESPFPKAINRTIFEKFLEFTPEAKAFVTDKVGAYTEQLIVNAEASAADLDIVNTKNVKLALDMQHPLPRSRSRKFAGIFGGIFLGAGLSTLISMLTGGQISDIGLILAFGLGIVGAFLVAFDN